ncbi:MAG: N-acyl-D-amino-acid deacylase family protein [Acidimicrobiales bacterium]
MSVPTSGVLAAGADGGAGGPSGASSASAALADHRARHGVTAGPARRVVITGGLVVDGTGHSGRLADVDIVSGQVAQITPAGSLQHADADRVEDAGGLVVCPGFIDPHSHSDESPFQLLDDTSKILQGITTEIVGNCGTSPDPRPHGGFRGLYERLDDAGYVTNYCPLVGHGRMRETVMGMNSARPDAEQAQQMGRMLDDAMEAGAWGLSSGLIYPPGVFSDSDELVALAQRLPKGCVYATHMRDEGRNLHESIAEALDVARRAGVRVQISHLKAAGIPYWGSVGSALAQLDEARSAGVDVNQDVYPYDASSTTLLACLPPWFQEGGADAVMRRLQDAGCLTRVRRDIEDDDGSWENVIAGEGYDRIQVASAASPEHEGATLAGLASSLGVDPFDVVVQLLLESRLAATIVDFSMDEADMLQVLAHPNTSVCTDGDPDHLVGKPHPRLYGSFPRVLGRYVRERQVLGLETAVRKMTSLTADVFGLTSRGRLYPGYVADVVVFDPGTIMDRGTYSHPKVPPQGVRLVMQRGIAVVRDGAWLGVRRGRRLVPGEG